MDEHNVNDFDEVDDDDFIEEEAIEDVDDVIVEEKTLFSNPIETLLKYHPECVLEYEESEQASIPIKSAPPVDDKFHRSAPFLSIYEYTKILGMRTNQLAQGARPYIQVPQHITDVQEIARLELDQRKLPILIKRHMPDGTFEKFRLADLMIL
jgi:DNA-directed RNA polymerase I, II, and III subunit RPABC2